MIPRKEESGTVVTVHSTLEEIPAVRWNATAAEGGFYSSHGWLRLFEGSERILDGLEPGYVSLSRAGELVAVAACYTAREPSFSASVDPFREYMEGAGAPPVAEESLYPVTICEPPVGFSNRLLVKRGLDAATRRDVVRRLVEEVLALAAARGSRLVAFGHLPVAEAAEVGAVRRMTPVFALAEATLPLEHGMAGYLKGLNHSRRDNVKAEIRYFEKAGLHFRTMRFSEGIAELVPLFIAHERKFGASLDPGWVTGAFRKMAAGLDESSRLFCALDPAGKTIAGALDFVHDGIYYARFWGVDPESAPKRAALYFNCLYYEPIRAAEAEGVRAIHFGLDAIGAKVSHGCRVRSLWTMLSFANPPDERLQAHLRARSDARLAEQVDALVKIGRDEAWIEGELELAAARALTKAEG
jgi:predicted N-acyltransferase